MSRPHEEFQMLTAFAAMNLLSDRESKSLAEHLESCASCQLRLEQMKRASFAYFVHHCARPENKGLHAGVSDRFSRRLANLGISPSSLSISNPARSLRVAIAILAFAIVTSTVAGVLTRGHRQSSSEQTVAAQSVAESHATVASVFKAPQRAVVSARRKRPRRAKAMREFPSQAADLYAAKEHVPYFRLGYPEVSRKLYSEPFALPSVPSFAAVELGKKLNGAKTFELASLPALGQGDTGDGANALRFIPESYLAYPVYPGDISARAQFHMPPLTDGPLFSTDMRH